MTIKYDLKVILSPPHFGRQPLQWLFLLAAFKRSTAQTTVVEIRRAVEALQLPTHRNLPTQPVVAHIQVLQVQRRQLSWKTTRYLVVV